MYDRQSKKGNVDPIFKYDDKVVTLPENIELTDVDDVPDVDDYSEVMHTVQDSNPHETHDPIPLQDQDHGGEVHQLENIEREPNEAQHNVDHQLLDEIIIGDAEVDDPEPERSSSV